MTRRRRQPLPIRPSRRSLGPQRLAGIDGAGTTRRDETGEQRRNSHHDERHGERNRIPRVGLEWMALHPRRQPPRGHRAGDKTRAHHHEGLRDDQAHDRPRRRAERHPDAGLARPPADAVRQHNYSQVLAAKGYMVL